MSETALWRAALEAVSAHGLDPRLVAAPLVLGEADLASLRAAGDEVVAQLRALRARGLAPVLEELKLDAWERPFLALDGGLPLLSLRLDVSYDPADRAVHLLEVQAGDPSGHGWSAIAFDACRGLVDDLHEELGFGAGIAAALRPLGPVAFFVEPSSLVWCDYEALAAALAPRGVDAVVLPWTTPPPAGRFVVRDCLEEWAPHLDENAALLARARAGEIANAPHDHFFDRKVLLSRLDAACLPETRLITTGEALPRDGWVLKPSDGWGGRDVLIGADVDEDTWRRALDDEGRRWIAQREVPIPTGRTLVEGEPVERRFVLSLWYAAGVFAGAFVRYGEDKVINVHRGGAIAPVLFAG